MGDGNQPDSGNGRPEAINGRFEQFFGSALRFRNFTDDIARSVLESSVLPGTPQ